MLARENGMEGAAPARAEGPPPEAAIDAVRPSDNALLPGMPMRLINYDERPGGARTTALVTRSGMLWPRSILPPPPDVPPPPLPPPTNMSVPPPSAPPPGSGFEAVAKAAAAAMVTVRAMVPQAPQPPASSPARSERGRKRAGVPLPAAAPPADCTAAMTPARQAAPGDTATLGLGPGPGILSCFEKQQLAMQQQLEDQQKQQRLLRTQIQHQLQQQIDLVEQQVSAGYKAPGQASLAPLGLFFSRTAPRRYTASKS